MESTSPGATTIGTLGGLRLLHVDQPGRTKATLHVGVGWADETMATRGVTHLVEHLVMHGTSRGRFESNAAVLMHRTAFWAAGRPELVATFLREVVAGITSPSFEDLEHEAKVLAAEQSEAGFGPHDAARHTRFGNEGPGLSMIWGTGPQAAERDVLADHVRRWFVRDNAVLTVVGPLPEGLDLDLPPGAVPVRPFVQTSRPGVVGSSEGAGPVLSFVLPDGPVVPALVGAICTRLEDELRHGQGDVYSLEPDVERLPGTGRVLVQLGARVAPGAQRAVAEAMARELARRTEVGVTDDERSEMLEWWDAGNEERDPVDDLDEAAARLLAGLPVLTYAEARAEAAELEPAAVAVIAQEALHGAQLLVPSGIEPDTALPDGTGCSMSRVMTTPPMRRRFRASAAKGSALGFDGQRVEFRDTDGDVHTIELGEVVGVGVDGRARQLFGARGCFITVDPRDFSGADAVVTAIDAEVSADLRFDLKAWLGQD